MISEKNVADAGLWIDQPDAEERFAAKKLPPSVEAALRSLMTNGIAIVKGAVDPDLCASVVADYARYCAENESYVDQNRDIHGREKRLVNFHHWSKSAEQLGSNPKVMAILDALFESETSVYTSLTFKYGTQQPVHRDTPHFATWPESRFVGVWTALENVRQTAGPLFYHPTAHRFKVDRKSFMDRAVAQKPDATLREQRLLALDLYNGEIIRQSPTVSAPQTLDLDAGDTVIWHPQLPHGGTPASNLHHTRWSMVFHCAPANVQVHQHDAFFSHHAPEAPADRYGYREAHDRKFAIAGEVSFMD